MANGKYIAYYRVSTGKQKLSGLGLEAQRDSVADYLNGGTWTLLDEYTEVETGKSATRPQLAQALAMCRLQGATLVVAKLDRLARNLNFLSNLMEAGVEFVAADMPSANRLTIHVLAAVAEAEALAISQRTKGALRAAKARGVVLGGYHGQFTDAVRVKARRNAIRNVKARVARRNADLMPIIEGIKAEGAISLNDIAVGLNARGIKTTRGCEFTATQVMRILQ